MTMHQLNFIMIAHFWYTWTDATLIWSSPIHNLVSYFLQQKNDEYAIFGCVWSLLSWDTLLLMQWFVLYHYNILLFISLLLQLCAFYFLFRRKIWIRSKSPLAPCKWRYGPMLNLHCYPADYHIGLHYSSCNLPIHQAA